jgi:hypothetical protein
MMASVQADVEAGVTETLSQRVGTFGGSYTLEVQNLSYSVKKKKDKVQSQSLAVASNLLLYTLHYL